MPAYYFDSACLYGIRSYLLPDTVTRTSVPLLVAQPDGFEHHRLLLVRNSDKEREKNVDLN